MPELTDAQKVNREVTQKRIATALETIAAAQPRPNGLPAGGTDGDVLVKNGATDYAARWTNTPPQMGSLATIEPTSSASKAYAAGDYLVYNGQLYKVTGAISQGETLTPGANIVEERVMDVAAGALKYGESTATLATAITAQQGTAVAFEFYAFPNAERICLVMSMASNALSNPAAIVITGQNYVVTTEKTRFYVVAYMAATSDTLPEGTSILLRYLYE